MGAKLLPLVLAINFKWTLVGPICWWSRRWLGDVLHRRRQAAGWQPVWWIKAILYGAPGVFALFLCRLSYESMQTFYKCSCQLWFMQSWDHQSCAILGPSMVHPALSFHTRRDRVQVRDGSGKKLLVDTSSRCRNCMVLYVTQFRSGIMLSKKESKREEVHKCPVHSLFYLVPQLSTTFYVLNCFFPFLCEVQTRSCQQALPNSGSCSGQVSPSAWYG